MVSVQLIYIDLCQANPFYISIFIDFNDVIKISNQNYYKMFSYSIKSKIQWKLSKFLFQIIDTQW